MSHCYLRRNRANWTRRCLFYGWYDSLFREEDARCIRCGVRHEALSPLQSPLCVPTIIRSNTDPSLNVFRDLRLRLVNGQVLVLAHIYIQQYLRIPWSYRISCMKMLLVWGPCPLLRGNVHTTLLRAIMKRNTSKSIGYQLCGALLRVDNRPDCVIGLPLSECAIGQIGTNVNCCVSWFDWRTCCSLFHVWFQSIVSAAGVDPLSVVRYHSLSQDLWNLGRPICSIY